MEVATSYTVKRMQEQSLFDLVERTAGYEAVLIAYRRISPCHPIAAT